MWRSCLTILQGAAHQAFPETSMLKLSGSPSLVLSSAIFTKLVAKCRRNKLLRRGQEALYVAVKRSYPNWETEGFSPSYHSEVV
jgi:hypothetical protein